MPTAPSKPTARDASGYHAASARAFSLSASHYDADQAHNRTARWSRIRNLRILDKAFLSEQLVLELGCGTGDEALHLAGRGVQVVATDAAPGMVEALECKLASLPAIADRVTTIVLPAGDVGVLLDRYGPASFDGAYSSFGPLNCEPDLAAVVEGLGTLVRPGGRLVLSLINRYCLWETVWHLATLRPRKAFRRWNGRASATVRAEWQSERIEVFYWTPSQVEAAFSPHFKVTRRIALPWLLPPQYLDRLVRCAPNLFGLLARVDRLFTGFWPFYAIGDHFLIEFNRVDE